MTALQTTPIIDRLADVADRYDALYCDLWGCLHNGIAAYPAAVAALRAFRAQGKSVILMTNAPRAGEQVARHLSTMGAPEDCRDAIVSSGDAARNEVRAGRFGRRVEYVGPPRDLDFFDGLGVELVGPDAAESVICIGLFDDSVETPETYAPAIRRWRARGLPMLCANPDLIVDRGHERLYCAGAIAEAYRAAGGAVTYSGKPHAPIYTLGAQVLARLRGPGPHRILAVGDGVATDVAGAAALGIDTLFVTGGLAAAEVSDDPETPDPARLAAWLGRSGAAPTYAIGRLR